MPSYMPRYMQLMLEGILVKHTIIILLLVAFLFSAFLSVIALSNNSVSLAEDDPQIEAATHDEESHADTAVENEQVEAEEKADSEEATNENQNVADEGKYESVAEDGSDETAQSESDYASTEDDAEDILSLERNVGIAPTVSNIPNGYTVIDMHSGANFADILRDNTGDLVLVLHADFTWSSTLTISGTRRIIIASAGTNLTTHATSSRVFTINTGAGNSNRHIAVTGGATLTLSNVALNGGDWSGGMINRGGVRVTNGTLNMENGSIIHWCRWSNGGGVEVFSNGRLNMNGGLIANNRATNGAGVYFHGAGSVFTMRDGTIENNTATNGGGVFVEAAGTFNMQGGTIRNNTAADGGGAQITGAGSVFNMSGGAIRNNTATNGGGVFIQTAGTFNMNNDTIRDNTATNGGGVFIQTAGTFNMNGGRIRSNSATLGGGVHVTDTNSTFRMRGGLIDVNVNVVEGGGVWAVDNARFIMEAGGTTAAPTSGRIADNNATGNDGRAGGGGVMVIDRATFEMSAGVIERNTAVVRGGGINVRAASVTISNGTIRNNEVTNGNGGAIHLTINSNVTMTGGEITNNTASNQGGGVFIWSNSTFTMRDGVISNNAANIGAGVGIASGTTFEMENGTIRNNTAETIGGGVEINGGDFTMHNGEISGNEAPRGGGGVHARPDSVIVMHDGKIINNTVSGAVGRLFAGGGIAVEATSLTINGGNISGNSAIGNGGGIHVWRPSSENTCNINGGTISGNIANNGGGLYAQLNNNWTQHLTVAEEVIFTDNVARNGLRVDNELAQTYRESINPGTVSVAGVPIIAPIIDNPADFALFTTQHAFTNYDINADGETVFWRVEHRVGEGDGEVSAVVGQNRFDVPNNAFVSDNAVLTFIADPENRFIDWQISTRPVEGDSAFIDQGRNYNNIMQHTLTAHMQATANFRLRPTIASLTVSKEVTGEFGNLTMDFDFTIYLTDINGNPLPAGTEFNYVGGIISDSNAIAPSDGTLELDSEGSAEFQLRHGQSITIIDLPYDAKVRVVETRDLNYVTSFSDSEDADSSIDDNDTTLLIMTEDRTISFVNYRFVPPPTGLNFGDIGAIWLLALLSISAIVIVYVMKRILFTKKHLFGCIEKR